MAKIAIKLFSSFVFALTVSFVSEASPLVGGTNKTLDPTSAQNLAKQELLKNFESKNQVKLLNNRFRIDYEIEEIMLVFFRKKGAAPVVLVQPDGSKLYITHDDGGKNIEWHGDTTYDLIRIKKPMPGPWQALGKILPDSKVLILSDVELEADPIPNNVYQYERIKSQARILNAQEMIKLADFKEVVRLRAYLYPTNDTGTANFGADIYKLGEFLDNGRDLDEKAGDGQFTVAYHLNLAHGPWIPKFRVKSELFTRELDHEQINILPSPVSFDVKIAEQGERYHYVNIVVDDSNLDNDHLIFQGRITLPNGEIQTFNIADKQSRELQIFHNDYGKYEIVMEVFGNTKQGREFVLDLPAFEFYSIEPVIEADIIEQTEQERQRLAQEEEARRLAELEKAKEIPVALVVLVNIVILVIGFLVIWLFVLNKPIPNPMPAIMNLIKKKNKDETDSNSNDAPATKKEEKKEQSGQNSVDILDLSLPDD